MDFWKYLVFLFVIMAVNSAMAITSGFKNTPKSSEDFLWNLANAALEGRQNYASFPSPVDYPTSHGYRYQKYPYKYRPYYPNYGSNDIASYRPYPSKPYRYPSYQQEDKQSVMDVLFSIAQNDDLQCVPRLVCEFTSGAMYGRQQGFNLPINIDSESLITFLASLNSAQSSPILHFGKAAALGLASKGHSTSCSSAYPRCPADPEKLITYLNNHNGGFFRFFQGLNQQDGYSYGKERILNHAVNDVDSNDVKTSRGVKFPSPEHATFIFPSVNEQDRSPKILQFPTDEKYPYRQPKKIQAFPDESNYLDIQKPLPNHIPNPNIFPDRTGTGELKLDNDEVDNDYKQSIRFERY